MIFDNLNTIFEKKAQKRRLKMKLSEFIEKYGDCEVIAIVKFIERAEHD